MISIFKGAFGNGSPFLFVSTCLIVELQIHCSIQPITDVRMAYLFSPLAILVSLFAMLSPNVMCRAALSQGAPSYDSTSSADSNVNLVYFEREPVFDMQELIDSVRYPFDARMKGIQGTVRVNVLIGKNGTTLKAYVDMSAHPVLDNEALRVIRNFKKWTPAVFKGEPADCWMIVPIKFRLRD